MGDDSTEFRTDSADDVSRVDFGRFDGTKVQMTPQGGLKVPAYPTRTGVLTYQNPDGTVRREYRPADEVFSQDSLATLENAPVTKGHPGMVTAKNYSALTKGHVRDIKPDGQLVAATALVQDEDIVQGVQSGALKELSCGYVCKLDFTPGVAPDGTRYDAIQRNIRYNHVALLPPGAGRAGSEVSLRLDSATAVQVRDDSQLSATDKDTIIVKTIRIDGVDYVIGSAEHLAKIDELHKAEVAKLTAELTTARKDAKDATEAKAKAEAERDVAKADASDARDPVKQAARVEARTKLETSARKVLGEDAKFDGKSDDEVRELVVTSALPDLKFDGLDAKTKAIHVTARFDAIVDAAPVGNPAAAARASAHASVTPHVETSGGSPRKWTAPPLAMSLTK